MRATARRTAATLFLLCTVTSTQGCSADSQPGEAADPQCADRVLDLETPPTRAGLQMSDREGSTTWSCDEGFQVAAKLPGGRGTTLLARQLSVDSYGAKVAETGRPTTVDIHSTGLGVEAAVKLTHQVSADLGIDTQELKSWSAEAERSETSGDVATGFMRNRVGYATTELQVVHQGVSGNNYVHLIVSWGR